MYKFGIRFKDRKIIFENNNDKDLYETLADTAESNDVRLILTLEESVSNQGLTENQIKLWSWIVLRMAKESGDTFDSIQRSVAKEALGNENISIESLNNEEFNILFNHAIDFANSFLNLNITYNPKTDRYE